MNKKDLEEFLLKGNLNLLPATFLDEKDSHILSRVSVLTRYWPDDDLYPSLLHSILRFPREFKKIRNIAHLGRLICAEFFYKKKVIKAINQYPQKRHLYVKLLKTRLEFPFGSKTVLGMVVTFNLLRNREAFEEQHVLEAVRRIIPEITVVRGSFLDHIDKQNQVLSVYLEIEREERPELSLDEISRLQERLPDELKGCIEQLVPMTFMRRNEEEVYRNILLLRDQLKSSKDIPQATITFEEQTQFDLFFTVVLLRLTKGSYPSVQELFEKQHPDVVYIPDRVDIVGTVRKIYRKEATVFRLQLPKNQFFRKDRSVNLYKARKIVVSMLVKALGPIRDFNGGLILKQNERLEDFLAAMSNFYDEFFLENFFYSITPIAMQSVLPAHLIKEWFLGLNELMEKEISKKEIYLLSSREFDEVSMVYVRSEDHSFKKNLLREVSRLGIPSLELAFCEVNRSGMLCLGFLHRPSLSTQGEDNFYRHVRNTMEKWADAVGEEQCLNIALHATEPSLDPRITKGDQSYIIIRMLFDGLTRIEQDGMPHLAMAESYEVSEDFKQYTFYLREGSWSNGMPITAYDFEYSWKKALNPQTHSVFSHTLFLIKNGRLAKENKVSLDEVGIRALNDKTLVVDLEHPTPYFLEVTSHWTYSLINSVIDKKYPGWALQADENFVCNGPFKLIEWKHHRKIIVEKNPYYWDANSVKLNKISISIVDRGQSNVEMLTRGELDILGRPMISFPAGGIDRSIKGVERETYPCSGVYTLYFNTTQFPFNHKKIRQAFAYAINRKELGEFVPHEFGGPSYTLLPKNLSLNQNPVFPQYNVEKARQLFREGLGEIGFVKSDFPRLTLSFFAGLNRNSMFQVLCEQWKEAFDIDVYLKSVDWESYFDSLVKGEFQMGANELNARWGDPLHLLEFFEAKADLLNFASWEHPCFQELLKEGKKGKVIDERNHYLRKAESLLGVEVPAIPLYQLTGSFLKKDLLRGVFTSPYSQIDFKWAYKL